ncbi:adenylyltransferase/cytidyltransferase family protein [Endozoicomonas arenosclerae]|uniref:adenylyltransferase/cytidyltransferase family protein n=1 Tax=Endozoicomonas arenosclerae TaxID=1633495 RepID=UPI00078243C0|nr:adenylyltransferase/cytidyltransferase family protein [Endozoicomonas arenosclerae]
MKNVITFGTFDVFHFGHARILERAKEHGDRLIVGVSTDNLNLKKKSRRPLYKQNERLHIINSLKSVDMAFYEESLEMKREYIIQHNAHTLVMGDDWKGKFDHLNDICDVVYLERTPSISTTEIIEIIRSQ